MKPILIQNNRRPGNNKITKGLITPKHEKSIELYLNEIGSNKSPLLTKSGEKELYEKYKNGDQAAFNKLVESNLKFVVSVAKQYLNQGLPFEDLINEGNIGLIRAIKTFDPDRNLKLISYAVWWIRQSILAALLETGRLIRIPTNKRDALIKINSVISKLEQQYQRTPTVNEIVDYVDDLDNEDIGNILRSELTVTSFDSPLFLDKNGDSTGSLYDILVSEELDYKAKHEIINNEINDLLKCLTEQERFIIEMYYGVLCDKKYTLEEIGERFNLTRERIRQIKENGIRKLKNNINITELKELLGNN